MSPWQLTTNVCHLAHSGFIALARSRGVKPAALLRELVERHLAENSGEVAGALLHEEANQRAREAARDASLTAKGWSPEEVSRIFGPRKAGFK
jgi:hypothetical protein